MCEMFTKRIPTLKEDTMPKKTIRVAGGIADFSHTEIENEAGRWDDHWQTKHGEYVIHKGKKHHVYKQRR